MITWDDFCQDFKAHHIPQSVVESKREEFRNLKQGSLSVYQYNIMFQKLVPFAKKDVPDEKSMIYQFRGGLREDLQLALVLFEPKKYDEFYNMALKQEAAQLKWDASKKRVRDATPSSSYSTQVAAKQQKYWLLLLLRSVSLISRRVKVAMDFPTHRTQAFRTKLHLMLQDQVLRITDRSQRLHATSVSRWVTMQTNASTRGVFRLLL